MQLEVTENSGYFPVTSARWCCFFFQQRSEMQHTHSPVRQRARQHMQLENDFTVVVYGVVFHVLLFITASLTLAVWTASAAAAASLGASSPPAPVPYPAASPAQASFASWPVCPRPPGDTHGETGRQADRMS